MLSPDLQRLAHIRDYCVEIAQTMTRYGESFDTFTADIDYQKSVSFSLLQIGELSGKLSEEFRNQTDAQIPWGSIWGMRNWFAHNYGSMSRDVIWKSALEDVPVLLSFCEQQLNN